MLLKFHGIDIGAGSFGLAEIYNVGICISSLTELEDILPKISAGQYMEMKKNVLQIADKLSTDKQDAVR